MPVNSNPLALFLSTKDALTKPSRKYTFLTVSNRIPLDLLDF
uniref:Uncharacterized protein n=1 Tax=Anguilla anguilla TaxID=7936 RepID=A0A0E9USB7_ANGAN